MVLLFKRWWNRLQGLPFGKWVFSRVLGWLIPYTGSVRPYVEEIRPGYARVSIRDCRRVRNHLRSHHAIAMANVGELSTGLALHFGLNGSARAILTRLSVDYLKKGRGNITAVARVVESVYRGDGPVQVGAQLFDQSGDLVAKIEATWLVDAGLGAKSLISNEEKKKLKSIKNTEMLERTE